MDNPSFTQQRSDIALAFHRTPSSVDLQQNPISHILRRPQEHIFSSYLTRTHVIHGSHIRWSTLFCPNTHKDFFTHNLIQMQLLNSLIFSLVSNRNNARITVSMKYLSLSHLHSDATTHTHHGYPSSNLLNQAPQWEKMLLVVVHNGSELDPDTVMKFLQHTWRIHKFLEIIPKYTNRYVCTFTKLQHKLRVLDEQP